MYTLPDLPYNYNALEPYIDEQTMRLHHDLHHGTYVKNLNDVLTGHDELMNMSAEMLISNLDKVPEDIRTKVRNNAGQHANHSLFWTIMGPQAVREPQGTLLEAINRDLGGFQTFKEEFSKAAVGLFGSGWIWLSIDNNKLTISTTPNGDSPLMTGSTPVLNLDVWEHAYYLKYQNKRKDYTEAWWNVVNWEEAAKRFETIAK